MGFRGPCSAEASPGDTHLDLARANVELFQDIDEEVLDLHPGVDAVGAVQDNDDVHVGLAPWRQGYNQDHQGTSVHKSPTFLLT